MKTIKEIVEECGTQLKVIIGVNPFGAVFVTGDAELQFTEQGSREVTLAGFVNLLKKQR